jgi:hypothetical protein
MPSLMLGIKITCFSSLEVFRPESRDEILLRGEGCNTPGVCHQLSNEFELKHDKLSGDEDVKVKPIAMSPNLNLDNTPLLTYRPFSRYMLG